MNQIQDDSQITSHSENEEPTQKNMALVRFSSLGIEIPASIGIGLALGIWIGGNFGHRELGALIGLGFGIAAVIRILINVIRLTGRKKE